ncbi:DUF2397 family protein [Kitasatospora sp. NPDC058965]|uniref:DUF2397 family protein n=1 Tax=Kitasatospora sp. NPDC058965 TaxID=3346682 RepID=UPI0036CEAE54
MMLDQMCATGRVVGAEGEMETDALLMDVPRGDQRRALGYLFSPSHHHYAAIMDVLDDAAGDLTLAQVTAGLRSQGLEVTEAVVARRLDRLHRSFEAVRPDPANDFARIEDLSSTRWRYNTTPTGRLVHRFWRSLREASSGAQEIPLTSLQSMVSALGRLAGEELTAEQAAQEVGVLFLSQEALDRSMEGTAESLSVLAMRFDLDREEAINLKRMLMAYASHVAAQVQEAVARAYVLLTDLRPRFSRLAAAAASQSKAGELVSRGYLEATRGSREEHWLQLLEWCRPVEGRAARFTRSLVLAIPPLHLNLRRLQGGGASSFRARALALARACEDREWGPRVTAGALGDQSWLKLSGWSDDGDGESWHDGPVVEMAPLERVTARSGGAAVVARAGDRAQAQALLEELQREQARARAVAIAEVLTATGPLSAAAGRVALEAVAAALVGGGSQEVKQGRDRSRRLVCTVSAEPGAVGRVTSSTWSALLPGWNVVFRHDPAPERPIRGAAGASVGGGA